MATVNITAVQLRKAVGWARPDPKHALPILGHMRVSVVGSQLVLASFDWETCLMARLTDRTAAQEQSASVLIPAAQLEAAIAVKTLKSGRVEVTVHDGDKIDLVAGTERISVGQPADVDPAAYPAMPPLPPITGYGPAEVLIPPLTQIAGCCSGDGTLPLIRAVHLYPASGSLVLEGTDAKVLGLDEVPFTTPDSYQPPKAGFLIPAPLVVKFAAGCEGLVFIGAPSEAGWAFLSDGWHTLVTRVTSGEYPKVRQRVNRNPPVLATFTCPAQTLAEAAETARGLLDTAVTQMAVDAVGPDAKHPVDIRRKVHHDHDGMGMFITVSQAGTEMFAVHPGTAAELGRWKLSDTTTDGDDDDEVVVSLNPALLLRVLPDTDAAVTVTLSKPVLPVKVTVDGQLYEGVICPIKADPPVRAETEKETVKA